VVYSQLITKLTSPQVNSSLKINSSSSKPDMSLTPLTLNVLYSYATDPASNEDRNCGNLRLAINIASDGPKIGPV